MAWGFYGRDNELEELAGILSRKRWFFARITGRRRIGKTTLIQQALTRAGTERVLYVQMPDSAPVGVLSAFADALVRAGLAPEPSRLDMHGMWRMMGWMYDPYRVERFRFERGWWERGLVNYTRPTNRNLRHQGLPPHWIWLQRAQFGLHAVLLKLEVEVALREPFLALLERPFSDATPPA